MRNLIVVAALLALAQPARAGSAGAESFDFLLMDGGARPAGLGGAYTALACDAHAVQYNPAGLGNICQSQATFMHNQYLESINQEVGAVSLRNGFGFSFNYLDFGSAPETTVSQIDGTGARVSLTDLALGAGYGRKINDKLSLGIGAKYISEVIAGYSASGFAFDLGAMYILNDKLSFGYALQNAGAKIKFQSKKEQVSLLNRLGAAYKTKAGSLPLVLALDLLKERSEDVAVAAGAELTVAKKLGLRLGYNGRNDAGTGLTLGMGWNEERWAVDYAFVPFGDLGMANRVSLSWKFGDSCKTPPPPPPVVAAPPPPPPPVEEAAQPEVAPPPPPPPPPPPVDAAEAHATGRLGALAVPGSVTPLIMAGVVAAKDDASCPWENEGVVCVKLAMEFEHDKADMKGDFASQLADIGAFLKANPGAKIELQGHTDSKGGLDHNIRLSRARAKSVKTHLIEKEGIAESRLTSKGLGYSKPTAPNDTEEGRQRNRRVMAILTFQ